MKPSRFFYVVVILLCSAGFALAQGSAKSSLAGVVVDTAGGVVPGATVTVKNNATARTFETLSNTAGAFSIPVLDPGTYTVTVALDGFKTAVVNDVRLLAATPGSIRATLEVGSLTETVEVKGGTELVQTQSATVSSTITTEQITNLPLVSRNALNFVVFLPGVETSAGPRGSTISGLPQNAISVTYDGVNVNNNFQSTDGFFSMVTPRLDAVEEVTVTGATPDGGSGRARRGADLVCHAVRHQQLRRQHLPLLPPPRAELELLLQQDPRARAQRRRRPPVRRPAGRADRHPRASSTAATRRSSSSTWRSSISRPRRRGRGRSCIRARRRDGSATTSPSAACSRCARSTSSRSRSRTISSRRSTRSRAPSSPTSAPPPERRARSPT